MQIVNNSDKNCVYFRVIRNNYKLVIYAVLMQINFIVLNSTIILINTKAGQGRTKEMAYEIYVF